MEHVILTFVNLFLAGILAGEEFVIYHGVRIPLSAMDEQPQIRFRQSLIRRLRVLVPAIFLPTAVSGVAVMIIEGTASGFGFRCAGALALLVWILITLIGTVPINKGTLDWQPEAPPGNWRAIFKRWERLDAVRSWAAVLAFAFFLTAVALQLAGN